LRLDLPVTHDAWTQTATLGQRWLELAPTGRERVIELGYRAPLAGGLISINSWWRRDPGHFAARADDLGAAIRFTLGY
jgi:hypothetical protein